MRFLYEQKISKTLIVISDIHLGAGPNIEGHRNHLEDFHYDKELVDFLDYYSSDEFKNRSIELIINGDFLDFLAVPFVKFFDDEYWSEKASLEKLKLILNAHPEVIEALGRFVQSKNCKITIIIGNHDGELVHKSLQNYLLKQFPAEARKNIKIIHNVGEYIPVPGVLLQHGHTYEVAHYFDPKDSIVADKNGNKYFIPPWGSYYVTRIINKFKEERDYINAVRPIKMALTNALIYDTLYIIRFMLANIFYFVMVRLISFFKEGKSLREICLDTIKEVGLFYNLEDFCEDLFAQRPEVGLLIVGHTHEPSFRTFADGRMYINTGTWTDMYFLEWGKGRHVPQLTYAQIDVRFNRQKLVKKNSHPLTGLDVAFNVWKGSNSLPYQEF